MAIVVTDITPFDKLTYVHMAGDQHSDFLTVTTQMGKATI